MVVLDLAVYNCTIQVEFLHIHSVVSIIFYLDASFFFRKHYLGILYFFNVPLLMCTYESDHAAKPPHDV